MDIARRSNVSGSRCRPCLMEGTEKCLGGRSHPRLSEAGMQKRGRACTHVPFFARAVCSKIAQRAPMNKVRFASICKVASRLLNRPPLPPAAASPPDSGGEFRPSSLGRRGGCATNKMVPFLSGADGHERSECKRDSAQPSTKVSKFQQK